MLLFEDFEIMFFAKKLKKKVTMPNNDKNVNRVESRIFKNMQLRIFCPKGETPSSLSRMINIELEM